jgi:hypothetical protein
MKVEVLSIRMGEMQSCEIDVDKETLVRVACPPRACQSVHSSSLSVARIGTDLDTVRFQGHLLFERRTSTSSLGRCATMRSSNTVLLRAILLFEVVATQSYLGPRSCPLAWLQYFAMAFAHTTLCWSPAAALPRPQLALIFPSLECKSLGPSVDVN